MTIPSARRSLVPLLALALLATSQLGCRLDGVYGFGLPFFRFESPHAGASLHGDEVLFDLRAPSWAGPLQLSIDGAPIPLAGLSNGNGVWSGALAGLEAGSHRLRATKTVFLLFFRFRLVAYTWFDVDALPRARFDVRESVEQLHVTHAYSNQALEVTNARGHIVAEGTTDELGSLIFRMLEPGAGYTVRTAAAPVEGVTDLEVMSVENSTPPRAFYADQVLEPGFGYIETRDGTKLSIYVQLPGPPEDGPYPTLVNYSGYSPSRPAQPLNIPAIDLDILCVSFPTICDAPNHPTGIIGGLMGYATVGVNMRGTGCSGGAWDFFEPLQVLDGYDLIETIAAQPWVKHNKVGMIGISYPGISQLFVAQAKPPGLAAITPLSVISNTSSTLAPGGLINDGFALQWAENVFDDADPYGQGWEQDLVDAGDTICEENQLLHAQKVDAIERAFETPYYTPEIWDPINPESFVDQIEVPVFTAGGWQDEQTGGHFPAMWDDFDNAPIIRFTAYNGSHAASAFPHVLAEWKNFLDLYVNKVVPRTDPLLTSLVPLFFQLLLGAPSAWPEERFTDFTDYADALAAYEAEPEVRIIFENGAPQNGAAGTPVGSFELFLDSWPPQTAVPTRFFLHPDGSLRDGPPQDAESYAVFPHDEEKSRLTFDVNGSFTDQFPDITWLPWEPDTAAVFVSEPLDADLVMLGHASADLWIQSTADDADLEVNLSEVRPDGKETYVQSGWLRASERALAPDATELRPVKTRAEADLQPLQPGEWVEARVEIFPFAHVFRAGSRIRISVESPGGNRPLWTFLVKEYAEDVTYRVSHSVAHPSSVVLPVLPGIDPPAALPPCPSLRSQPCREYVPHTNAVGP